MIFQQFTNSRLFLTHLTTKLITRLKIHLPKRQNPNFSAWHRVKLLWLTFTCLLSFISQPPVDVPLCSSLASHKGCSHLKGLPVIASHPSLQVTRLLILQERVSNRKRILSKLLSSLPPCSQPHHLQAVTAHWYIFTWMGTP